MADREWTDRRMIMTVDGNSPASPASRTTDRDAEHRLALHPAWRSGFLLIRISTTTQQPDTVLAIDRLDKEEGSCLIASSVATTTKTLRRMQTLPRTKSAKCDAGPMAETSPGPQSLLGETYDITEQNTTDYVGSKPVITETQNGGTVAGSYIREMLESGVDTAPSPLWIGYDEDANEGSVKHRSSLSRSSGTSGSPAPPATENDGTIEHDGPVGVFRVRIRLLRPEGP